MIERTLKAISFLLLGLFFVCVNETTAQETAAHLVITQVCLNNNQKPGSWIEIYNPADEALILERFRLSHLRTINVLPDSIKKEGGIKVGAGEYVILCADEDIFKSTFGDLLTTVKVKALSRIASGGFLAITTKEADITKGEIVRYGKEEYSSKIAELAGEQVVGFSEKGKSYTRKIEKSGTGIIVSEFTESSAEPGKSNN
ncbi:MAG: hypothetical protein PVH88_27510 [Ignavibacteria bacterium]|jgi:hypothetical protein